MMKNKKGFTLIELLAVIIILGVLMIIAIPSVTTYIQNSRKSAFVDSAVAYVDAVKNKASEGKKMQFYATDTLYLIPVGHESKKTCVSVESGGQSPFSDKWNYAYVGVIYTGEGFSYFFVGEDGANQGVPFLDRKTLAEDGTDYIYSSTSDAAYTENAVDTAHDALKTNYGKKSTTGENNTLIDHKEYTTIEATAPYAKLLTEANKVASGKTKVEVIYAGSCSNTGTSGEGASNS